MRMCVHCSYIIILEVGRDDTEQSAMGWEPVEPLGELYIEGKGASYSLWYYSDQSMYSGCMTAVCIHRVSAGVSASALQCPNDWST